jgi:hypothetical protein
MYILCSVTFFLENHVVYDMWKNLVEPDRLHTDDNVIWHMHFVCWIAEATNKHSEYIIHTAFPWQQWLFECTLNIILCVHFLCCSVLIVIVTGCIHL